MTFVHTLALAAMLALGGQAVASGWQLHPAEGDHGEVLTFGGETVSYRFECAANDMIVTETGVTKLMDLQTGKPVGDDAGAVMPPGAALLAVFGGKGDPDFKPASAVKNPAGGWDLTIRLPKNDKQLKAIGKSEMMSLFTTGYTMAVAMDADARATWSGFLKRCAS